MAYHFFGVMFLDPHISCAYGTACMSHEHSSTGVAHVDCIHFDEDIVLGFVGISGHADRFACRGSHLIEISHHPLVQLYEIFLPFLGGNRIQHSSFVALYGLFVFAVFH